MPEPVHMMLVGFPGSGKTGSLVSLAEAGWRLRIIDLDGNLAPIWAHAGPAARARIDTVRLRDTLTLRGGTMVPKGTPKAFEQAFANAIESWKDGAEKPSEWGLETVLVIDSLTALGEAAMRKVEHMTNRTPLNRTQQTWGAAITMLDLFLAELRNLQCHVILIGHLKIIGPSVPDKDLSKTNPELYDRLVEAAALVPPRLCPNVLGQALPPTIAGRVPILIAAENKEIGRSVKRVLITNPRPHMDVKFPAGGVPTELPIETGMRTLFEALGHTPPS